jgi:hypothetical protein
MSEQPPAINRTTAINMVITSLSPAAQGCLLALLTAEWLAEHDDPEAWLAFQIEQVRAYLRGVS